MKIDPPPRGAPGCHEPPPFAQRPRLSAREWVLRRRAPPPLRDRGGGRRGRPSRRPVVVGVAVAVHLPVVGVVAAHVVVRPVHAAPGRQVRHPRRRRHQVRSRGNATGVLLSSGPLAFILLYYTLEYQRRYKITVFNF